MYRSLTLSLLAGMIGIGSPYVATAVEAPSELQEMLRGIDGMRRLPVQGMQMVRAGERVLFGSANGRYVFTGPAWDLWHGAALESLETAGRLADRIDLQRLRLDPHALGALQLGKGQDELHAGSALYRPTGIRQLQESGLPNERSSPGVRSEHRERPYVAAHGKRRGNGGAGPAAGS